MQRMAANMGGGGMPYMPPGAAEQMKNMKPEDFARASEELGKMDPDTLKAQMNAFKNQNQAFGTWKAAWQFSIGLRARMKASLRRWQHGCRLSAFRTWKLYVASVRTQLSAEELSSEIAALEQRLAEQRELTQRAEQKAEMSLKVAQLERGQRERLETEREATGAFAYIP